VLLAGCQLYAARRRPADSLSAFSFIFVTVFWQVTSYTPQGDYLLTVRQQASNVESNEWHGISRFASVVLPLSQLSV